MLRRIEAKFIRASHRFFYFLVSLSHFLVFSLFLRIKIFGKENIPKKGRCIFAANHQNFYDGFFIAFIMGPLRKISFVIAKRALKLKFDRILAKLIGSVIIGNQIEEYQSALKKLNNLLSHGGVVGIFPEGDVSRSEFPRRFKGGVAKLSVDSKTKVIPVYIKNTYNLRYLRFWFTRPEIVLKIGKPIELYSYANEFDNDLDRLAEFLREKVIELGDLNKDKSLEQIKFTKLEEFTDEYNKLNSSFIVGNKVRS